MAEQLSRLPSRLRIPWITKRPAPTAPPANVDDDQATSKSGTTLIPSRWFSFQQPESITPSEIPPEPETMPQNLSPESPSTLEIKIQSTIEASESPSPASSEPPSPREDTIYLERTPSDQALESQPTLATPQHAELLSPKKQVPESQSNLHAIVQPPLPSDEEYNQAISQETSTCNGGSDDTQQSPVRSFVAPEPPQPHEGPELQEKPQGTVNLDQQKSQITSQILEPPLPPPLIKDSPEQSQTASSSTETQFASEKGPESDHRVQTISMPLAESGNGSHHQQQNQTTVIPIGSLSPTQQVLESPPTPQVISQPSPSSNSLHQQQQSQTSLFVEPLSQSGLSASESETTSSKAGHAIKALPKDQTEIQASSELEGVAKLSSQSSGTSAIDRDTSVKSQGLITPPQPSSPSHTQNKLAREMLSQTQRQATILSDGNIKESSETRSPAKTVEPNNTAAPVMHFPVQPPNSSSSSVILNDSTKSKETKEENMKREAESKTEDRLATLAGGEPEKRMMTKLLNSASESNKHSVGRSVTSKTELTQLEKQLSTRNISENAATHIQGGKGRVQLRTNPTNKIAGSRSQPWFSASQMELVTLNKEIREALSRFAHKLAQHCSHQSMDENALSVIALCGVNDGASMHVVPMQEKECLSDMVRGYQLNQGLDAEVNIEESSQEPIGFNDTYNTEHQARKAYINNNIQVTNNSILYISSLQEGNPGVHLLVSGEPKVSAILNTKLESIEASQKQGCKSTVEKENFNNQSKDNSASGAVDSNA